MAVNSISSGVQNTAATSYSTAQTSSTRPSSYSFDSTAYRAMCLPSATRILPGGAVTSPYAEQTLLNITNNIQFNPTAAAIYIQDLLVLYNNDGRLADGMRYLRCHLFSGPLGTPENYETLADNLKSQADSNQETPAINPILYKLALISYRYAKQHYLVSASVDRNIAAIVAKLEALPTSYTASAK